MRMTHHVTRRGFVAAPAQRNVPGDPGTVVSESTRTAPPYPKPFFPGGQSGATVIGKVSLGEQSSVWPSAVIRGDDNTIAIGDNTNVQDGAVLHVDPGYPMSVGANVTVGHQAMLHGCTIGDGSPVGIQAIVYNKAVIGRDC